MMKQIKAYIRPALKDQVIDAVEELSDAPGLTVWEAKGWGKPKEGTSHELTHRVLLELVVSDVDVDRVVDTILETAQTGRPGDGKIFVSDVDQGIRIRDKSTGDEVV
jgi:nitrogen regulatory protein PII